MADKTSKLNRKRDDMATTVAGLHGCSADLVRKVVNGDRENEAILTTYMMLTEGRTKLIQAVKDLVPIQNKPQRRPKYTLKDMEDRHK